MNAFERKIALRVFGIHVGVVVLVLMVAFLKGCFRPNPKPEMVTYIEFGQPVQGVQVEETEAPPDPEPPKPQPKPDLPKPQPKPDIPKPQPKPDLPKPQPRPQPKPKPKWQPTRPEDIDPSKSKKIEPVRKKPAISSGEIDQAFSDVTKNTGKAGSPSEIAAYDALIKSVLYNAWKRPAAPAMRPARVTISITAAGRIGSVRLSQSSGDAGFDASVTQAARSVHILPRKPPKGYPLNNIVVNFNIVD